MVVKETYIIKKQLTVMPHIYSVVLYVDRN